METDAARRFADEWCRAWNSHDLEQVLAHFTDDVVFTSPVAIQLMSGSDGVVRGKDALRDYWREGLRVIPDLHFEVIDVYAGVHTVVINYRNQHGRRMCEVLTFEGDLVSSGHGTYAGEESFNGA